MFLIRLIHLSSMKTKDNIKKELQNEIRQELYTEEYSKTVNQIKNITQEEKSNPGIKTEIKSEKNLLINSLEDLIEICSNKKEIKLKYELEKNVNLVKFENKRIEITFNDSLDKSFVKDLSSKLFEWTGQRWIITFSQSKGEISINQKKNKMKQNLINEVKNSEIYKDVLNNFPDAELVNVNLKKKIDEFSND